MDAAAIISVLQLLTARPGSGLRAGTRSRAEPACLAEPDRDTMAAEWPLKD